MNTGHDVQKLAECWRIVLEFFHGDEAKARLWFESTNPMLGMVSPMTMVRLGRVERLWDFITKAREGLTP